MRRLVQRFGWWITVKLTDSGNSGAYTAADEIRFTANAC